MTAVGRIVHARDFQVVLGTAARARSEHFALHHVAVMPQRAPKAVRLAEVQQHKLTTVSAAPEQAVGEAESDDPRLGLVVPKRHARRSVTRTLLKRQMRAAMQRHAAGLLGWWVVRLRTGFPVAQFRSAASDPLRQAASAELDALFTAGRRRLGLAPVAEAAAPRSGGATGSDTVALPVVPTSAPSTT